MLIEKTCFFSNGVMVYIKIPPSLSLSIMQSVIDRKSVV